MRFLTNVVSVSLATLTVVNAGKLIKFDDDKDTIPGEFVIVLNKGVSSSNFTEHQDWASSVQRVNAGQKGGPIEDITKKIFEFSDLKGYSGTFDDLTIDEIVNRPEVNYVEPNRIMRTNALETQPNAPNWGLGRISSKQPGATDYIYDSSAGEGITLYGVDTGIAVDHPDFDGRATWGSNHVDNDDTDGNGHGTHTASTMVGKTLGVAKKAKVIAVKVLGSDGSGSTAGIIDGMNWVVDHAKKNGNSGKAVMNLSLGGGFAQALNDAANSAVEGGVFLAVAAGNDGADAADYSPASAEQACTVGASAEDDSVPSFSNYGAVLDIYAPGEGIEGASPGGGSEPLDGTSMASPHVAGVGAYLMALEGLEPSKVCDRIKEITKNSVSNPGPDTTDKLLFNGVSNGTQFKTPFTHRRYAA